VEGRSRRIQQTEHRISELENEMAIKGKTEELLVKQLKTCEKKMQELTDSIKRTNLRIIGIEEGEEVKAKGMCKYIQQNNNRKIPKSRENYAHSDTGNLQNTEQS
jgi:septal ring factor EnvC (AmiA/AmiB activator)